MSTFPLLTPKPALTLIPLLPSQIYIVDEIFSHDELRLVRQWAESIPLEEPKKAGRGEAERTARRGALNSLDIASSLLNLLSPHISQLRPSLNPRLQPAVSPNIRLYHYPPGTYFRSHYDTPQMDATTRRLSCWTVLIYLSDVQGGGTTFWLGGDEKGKGKGTGKGKGGGKEKAVKEEKITVEAKKGRVLFHWHGVSGGGCLRHEGDEVLKGDKWVLRTDILG